jgi:hypothetical protein
LPIANNSCWHRCKQAAVLGVLGASDKALVDGGDEYLQLLNVACQAQRMLLSAA